MLSYLYWPEVWPYLESMEVMDFHPFYSYSVNRILCIYKQKAYVSGYTGPTTAAGLVLIKSFEGFFPNFYIDPVVSCKTVILIRFSTETE
jgi:hypothetical protein